MNNFNFEWDENKNRENQKRHKVLLRKRKVSFTMSMPD